MQQTVTSGHELNERAEVEDRADSTFVNLSLFGLCDDGLDFRKCCVDARLVFRGDLHAADSELLVLVDRDGCSGLFLNALDNLALGTDYGTDHLLRNLDGDQTRHVGLVVLAGLGDGLVDYVEDVQTSVTGLVECLLKHLVAQTVALDVHLGGGDTLGGTCHLEVHVAEVILVAKDVRQDGIFHIALVGDETHGHTGYGALHLHTCVEQRQCAAADSRH